MKKGSAALSLLLSTLLTIFILYCEPTSGKSPVKADFTLKDFDNVVGTVSRYYIDKNIDKNRAYREAAIYALLSLPHSIYLYPESYFKEREKYEEKDEIFPGKTFKISADDSFVLFDPDYTEVEKIRDRKLKEDANKSKVSDDEVKKIVEREKVRKNVLSSKWEQTGFSKKDFDRILAYIETNLDKYKDSPLKDPFGESEEKSKEPFTMNDVMLAAANGYLSSLDPHSNVFLRSAWEESMAKIQDGSFEGIGAILSGGGNREVVVENPLEGRPAVNAGIRSGDVILAVDGKSIKGILLDKVVEKIKGKKGSKVALTIQRKGVPGTLNIEVVRDTIEIKNLSSKLIEGHEHIGYIKLTGFVKSEDGPSVDRELVDKYKELEKEAQAKGTKLKAVILDLRSNAGGYLDLAIDIADMFIEKGLIVSTKSPNRSPEDAYAKNKDITNLPLAVLINAKSASASEIVASAIKHHGRGLILGERTFGKATVQKLMPLGNDYLIKLTQARYYSPSGNTIQVVGVKPDIDISSEEDGSFPFRFREENMWNHLSELPAAAEERSSFDVKKLEAWVQKNGKAAEFIAAHKNDPIKPDYQLIRSLDYIEALINNAPKKK